MMAAVTLFALPDTAHAQSFWNWGASDNLEPRPAPQPKRVKAKRKVDPAEAVARNAAKPQGPLIITVSIEKQRVKVYDSNGLFAEAAVSTGTRTHPTPSGVFSIIQKNKHHVSNLYNASMPYMQRITWSGVAMHTGPLPGYAASHGCIRMPNEFAARLWTWTKMGTRVIVAPGEVAPNDVSHPKLIAKMIQAQPTVSALPAPVVAAADSALTKSDRANRAQRRTADASDAISGIKGTLSDANSSATTETEVKPTISPAAEPKIETKAETKIEPKAEPKTVGIDTAGDAPAATAAAQIDAPKVDAPAETAATAETPKPVETDSRDTASKTQDRMDGDTPAVAETKAADTAAPAQAKPAEAVREIATPLETIAKPADIARSPETAKPVEAAKPAGVAKPAEAAAPAAVPDAVKPVAAAKPRAQSHVAVFISRKDKKLYVRQGYEPVFDVPIEIADADRPLGTHVFTARGDKDDSALLHWSVVSLPQLERRADTQRSQKSKAVPAATATAATPPLSATDALDRVTIPTEAMDKIAAIIAPGGSLLISDHGLGWETGRGTDFIVPLR
jgi:hypothetical protein